MSSTLRALLDAQRQSRKPRPRARAHRARALGALTALTALALGTAALSVTAATPVLKVYPYGDGTVQAGAAKAATCGACHGPNGNSTNPQWPRLAGQNAVYIDEQLQLFKAGVRNNPIMMPMATMLSDKDIDNIAVYYEAQTPIGLEADPSYWQAGEKLYKYGDSVRNIPACIACHGPVGRGNLASGYPALRAQYAQYVIKQLQDFASGARYAGAGPDKPQSRNGAMMQTIAKLLTPVDMRNLASYVQGMR